jgi:ATP-dependent helicase/nuclease subunit B
VLEAGGFEGVPPAEVSELLYVRLSGGDPIGELISLGSMGVMETARTHLAGLKRLLVEYADERNAYIPRRIPKTETEVSPYDHLSRRGEWERKEAAE